MNEEQGYRAKKAVFRILNRRNLDLVLALENPG